MAKRRRHVRVCYNNKSDATDLPRSPIGGWPVQAFSFPVQDLSNFGFKPTGMLREAYVSYLNAIYAREARGRGVTSRSPREGGKQEPALAEKYRGWSKATAFDWPRTSSILENLAKSYEEDARSQDESAERLDWR